MGRSGRSSRMGRMGRTSRMGRRMAELEGAGRRGPWKSSTVVEVHKPSPRIVMLRLEVPDRPPHLAGQHYIVRLTAPDGYTASRSYSLASAPADPLIELGVEMLPDGEVSGYLGEVVVAGDQLEVRGPIGLWFVWRGEQRAVGIGGGSGVVPLVAMMRHARDVGRPELMHLVVSARTPQDLLFHDEIAASGARIAYTRGGAAPGMPPGARPVGRLGAADIEDLIAPDTTYFVCGSAAFAEAMSQLLVSLGVAAGDVRVERFGPSGTD
jgi:ferredoxin-NADP reductase